MVTLGVVVNPASGVLLLALGIWIALKGPRGAAARWLAAFSASFGVAMIAWNAYYDFLPAWLYGDFDIPDYVASAFFLVAAGALFQLAAVFPRPLERAGRRLLLVPIASMVVVSIAWWADPPGIGWTGIRPTFGSVADAANGVSLFAQSLALSTFWGVAILFALRCKPSTSAAERRAYALLSLAIVLYPAYYAGFLAARFPVLAGSPAQIVRSVVLDGFAASWILACLWIRNTADAPEGSSAGARNMALTCLALPLAALLASLAVGPLEGDYVYGLPGLTRVASVLVLAYAILRHQLLGLDMKVRWTLSRGTVAAAFLAVFFVVTEVAKELFSESWGSAIGVGAAGALVFALNPIQRAAERFAERAVPVADAETERPPRSGLDPRVTSVYKAAVRTALADGAMTPEEEDHLAEVQEHLGLAPREALRLRREVEDERRP